MSNLVKHLEQLEQERIREARANLRASAQLAADQIAEGARCAARSGDRDMYVWDLDVGTSDLNFWRTRVTDPFKAELIGMVCAAIHQLGLQPSVTVRRNAWDCYTVRIDASW